MSNIHVNTDVMRHLGYVFVQLNEQITNSIQPQIIHSIGQLEIDWQGLSRQRFEELFSEWRALATRISACGEEIGRHLQVTAERFEDVDRAG